MRNVVVIGASAGGIDAIKTILPAFKKPSAIAVLLVMHMPPDKKNLLPIIYEGLTDFTIKEADSGEQILSETIYVAPPDYHLSVEANGTLSLSSEPPVNFSRPSIDITMESVAFSYGKKAVGILLTGANHDGAAGMLAIHWRQGHTIVQNPASAEFPTMPASCMGLFTPDQILELAEIHKAIGDLNGTT
jgi:two-component system, chemotaxis family, protein-glutamate methylesterase/glutaminase